MPRISAIKMQSTTNQRSAALYEYKNNAKDYLLFYLREFIREWEKTTAMFRVERKSRSIWK